jgi:hypothetical protein
MEDTTSQQSSLEESKPQKKLFNVTTKLTPRKPKTGIEKVSRYGIKWQYSMLIPSPV